MTGRAVARIVWSSTAGSIASTMAAKARVGFRVMVAPFCCRRKVIATIIFVRKYDFRHGPSRAQEGADAHPDRRDGPPSVRRAGVRGRDGGGCRGGRRRLAEDGLQLLPDQGGPRLLAAGVLRGRAAGRHPR